EWTWLDPSCGQDSPLPGFRSLSWTTCMLGVPLGSDVNVAGFVEEKLIGRAKSVMEKLSAHSLPSTFFGFLLPLFARSTLCALPHYPAGQSRPLSLTILSERQLSTFWAAPSRSPHMNK